MQWVTDMGLIVFDGRRGAARIGLFCLALLLAACTAGDNSAVRAFYTTVKPATPLLNVIRNAEAVHTDKASFMVVGEDCAGPYVHIGRGPQVLRYIRVTQPHAGSDASSPGGYSEFGYATREEFVKGLAERLPSFYSCERFLFQFGRDQFWPTSDSFHVTVDANGQITSVSELKEDTF